MPFLSAMYLFCQRVAAPAQRGEVNHLRVVWSRGVSGGALWARPVASGEVRKKARVGRAVVQ